MKIEFIKEVKAGGIDTHYYTTLNGRYVSGSTSLDKEKGMQYYELVKKNLMDGSKEVLISEEIAA